MSCYSLYNLRMSMTVNDWSGKGVDEVVGVGDALLNTHSGETFLVLRVSRHNAVARSDQNNNQVAIPRHQFIDGDFVAEGAQ
ncbi:Uncharacterised protein [Mycobacteroides abscessus subsp. abscessus]|nr:Uncharacterised protein [Mycobacteroides abscessus subsp. abscessus]SIJ97484.1 Uncharacterised protein [Mycobacteroides abscessus subsp. abscessus]